ncbi:DEAD/DEAH box helicase [Oceaniglobus ichthyenteri]|uniref:DEAD/DEAH box helicase n=1 Tax=Oceaniglobus ichthyenteri TaxID=2136177 RepID=UPI000D3D6F99|nr:DEAD/DEAH box helicase [Oceaniglobus ichthyenteri]
MTKFSDLNLDPKITKAIAEAGYDTPTPIQSGAIPAALQGRDVLGIAQTGTGKTAGFTLPMIHLLGRGRARARMPRSLVLAPTRELAAQVAENFDTYSKYTKLTKALLIGGVSFKEQDLLIDRGVDVLIATPGRLLDHFERGKLLLTGVQIMVVDEADRMLDMGFIPDIERIFSLTPFTRQTLFFSATMAPEIERITNTFLSNPEKVEVARQATASETIEQGVVMFRASRKDRQASEKRKILRALIDGEGEKCSNAIIFCNRKTDVDIVAKSLTKNGYNAAPIHGDLDQSQRTKTLESFREGGLRFLVASDVAARGLDVPAVSHVFNFDVPSHAEDYIHRIGRTGRAGRDGKAMMICVPSDEKNLDDIERLIGKPVPRLENPLGETPAAAPEEHSDDAPKPEKRSRSRTRKPKAETPVEATPEAAAEAATPAPQPKPEPAPERKPAAETEKEQPRGRGGRGRNDRHDHGQPVVGMGDHLPSFIAKSFDERRTG